MAYSSLGGSLPDLQISGVAGPVAAWGGQMEVTIRLINAGASTTIEPLSLAPISQVQIGPAGLPVPPYVIPSSAAATASQVGVFLTRRPRSLAGAIQIGTIEAPPLAQNSFESFDASVTLPARPAGFPATGRFYIRLVANNNQAILESNQSNNVSQALPVRIISQSAPRLTASALDVPPVMQPGDAIAPTFQVTNLGTAGTAAQGPVQVALVASTTPDFNVGSSILAVYTIPENIPGASSAPVGLAGRRHPGVFSSRLYTRNVNPGNNTLTYNAAPVTLPKAPATYFIGVVVDPYNRLTQLSLPANRLEQIRVVGPSNSGLPPAGVVSAPRTNQFPNPPDGVPIGNVSTSASSGAGAGTTGTGTTFG